MSYKIMRDQELLDFIDLLKTENPVIAVDTECTGLFFKDKVVGLSFSWQEGNSIYVPLLHPGGENCSRENFVLFLEKLKSFRIVYHNAKYDRHILYFNFGKLLPFHADTMLYAYLNSEDFIGLKPLSAKYFAIVPVEFKDLMTKYFSKKWKSLGKNWSDMDLSSEGVLEYACSDADFTLRLYYLLKPLMAKYRNILKIEENLSDVVLKMNHIGAPIDPKILTDALAKMDEDLEARYTEICTIAGRDLKVNSPVDMAAFLFGDLKLPVIRRSKDTGAPSTDAEVLEELSAMNPVVNMIKTYREDCRMKVGYLEKIPASLDSENRIHTVFSNIGAASGRFTSSSAEDEHGVGQGLNLQNIPVGKSVDVRSAFIAPEGWTFVKADYSQIEYRVMASLSGDEYLISNFKAGTDFHTLTASTMLGIPLEQITPDQRQLGKIFNFGLSYGMSSLSLSQRTGRSEEEAERLVEEYFARTPKLVALIAKAKERAVLENATYTFFGRYRKLDFSFFRGQKKDTVLRKSFNTMIQGTAADLLKIAMLRVNALVLKKYKGDVELILTVHDELDFIVKTSRLNEIVADIKSAMEFPVPIEWAPIVAEISIGKSWSKHDQAPYSGPVNPQSPFEGWKKVLPDNMKVSLDD